MKIIGKKYQIFKIIIPKAQEKNGYDVVDTWNSRLNGQPRKSSNFKGISNFFNFLNYQLQLEVLNIFNTSNINKKKGISAQPIRIFKSLRNVFNRKVSEKMTAANYIRYLFNSHRAYVMKPYENIFIKFFFSPRKFQYKFTSNSKSPLICRYWWGHKRRGLLAAIERKKRSRLFKIFCDRYWLFKYDGKLNERKYRRYRWRFKQFVKFKGNWKLYYRFRCKFWNYKKHIWALNKAKAIIPDPRWRSAWFWRFISKPFFFWMIFYFNHFFLIYYKVLFSLWIRYMFRLVKGINFTSIYGIQLNFNKLNTFLWFSSLEDGVNFIAHGVRKQFYYFTSLYLNFRAAKHKQFRIPFDLFWHFQPFRFKFKQRLFRRRYKIIYVYFKALKVHLYRTRSISGWVRVLSKLKFTRFIAKGKKLRNLNDMDLNYDGVLKQTNHFLFEQGVNFLKTELFLKKFEKLYYLK